MNYIRFVLKLFISVEKKYKTMQWLYLIRKILNCQVTLRMRYKNSF